MANAEPGAAPVPSGGGPLVFVADLSSPWLDDSDHHHLAKARRLRVGDPLILSDGAGSWCPARFAGHQPEPTGPTVRAAKSAPPIGVAFALVKGAKPDLVVQKLTELGVDRIQPFVAARSVVRWDASRSEGAHRRLERVAREAAMQSRRPWLATVHAVTTYALVAAEPGAARADRGGGPPTLATPLVLIGPEGGWDLAERGADLPVVGLGDGVLRAETAAIAAGTILAALRAGLVAPAADGERAR